MASNLRSKTTATNTANTANATNTATAATSNNGSGDAETAALQEAHRLLALDKLYVTPPFQIRAIADHEKLSGHKNYKAWRSMVELDLRALNLLPFIESDCGMAVNVSPAKRVVLDAQTVQYLRASISKSICHRITNSNILTAYKTFQTLVELFAGNRTQDYIALHDRMCRLKFRPGYDDERFIGDFQKLLEDYDDIGTIFNPEYIKSLFLSKIEGINDPKSYFFGFNNNMLSIPNITFETIKEKFSEIAANVRTHINRNNQKRKSENSESRSNYQTKQPRFDEQLTTSGMKSKAVPISEKYTKNQREQLAKMSKEEKQKVRCRKCGEYFHTASECKNPGRMCYKCFQYGHEKKDCPKKGTYCNLPINLFNSNMEFFIDSAASVHIVSNENILLDFKVFDVPKNVGTIESFSENSTNLFALGSGTLPILVSNGKTKSVIYISDVLFVPNSNSNIICAALLNKQFKTSLILNERSGFITSRKLKCKLATIYQRDNVFILHAKTLDNSIDTSSSVQHSVHSLSEDENLFIYSTKIKRRNLSKISPQRLKMLEKEGALWHRRMGHISTPIVHKLKSVTEGVNDLISTENKTNCPICAKAKQTSKSFNKDRDRASRPCEIIHVDLMGPISAVTFEKKNAYILCVIDDFTRFLQVFVTKTKSAADIVPCLNEAFRFLQAKFPGAGQFDILRCDGGTEFNNDHVNEVLNKYGIIRETSEAYCHEHNGLVERMNRTLQERARALLFESGFPTNLWGMAVHTACYIYNRTPHSGIDFITPFEKLYSKIPDVSNIKMNKYQKGKNSHLAQKHCIW